MCEIHTYIHTHTVQKSRDNRGFQEFGISHLYSGLMTAVFGFMYYYINCCKILIGNLRGRDMLEDLGVEARIILKLLLKHYDGRMSAAFTGI